MTKSSDSPVRITDLTWGQTTQFVTHLDNAGLTGDDVKRLLDNPELLKKVAEAAKSLIAESNWSVGDYYQPIGIWITVAPGVQIMRPRGCYPMDTNHVLIRVQLENCFCSTHWGESRQIRVNESWTDIAPGVQIRKRPISGVGIRTLKTS